MLGRKNKQAASGSTANGYGTNDTHSGVKSQPWYQKLLRVLQFLSAIISLALFSTRVAKVLRLTKKLSHSSGAVEGILAAAVAYTVLVTALQLCTRAGGPNKLRWLTMALDLAFVGGFIAVSVLTRPNGGPSGPCSAAVRKLQNLQNPQSNGACQLPLGTFVLAIFSTILHFITALFHTVRHRRQTKQYETEKHHNAVAGEDGYGQHNGAGVGVGNGVTNGHHNGQGVGTGERQAL